MVMQPRFFRDHPPGRRSLLSGLRPPILVGGFPSRRTGLLFRRRVSRLVWGLLPGLESLVLANGPPVWAGAYNLGVGVSRLVLAGASRLGWDLLSVQGSSRLCRLWASSLGWGLPSGFEASRFGEGPPVWAGASRLGEGPPFWEKGLPSVRRVSRLGWGLLSGLGVYHSGVGVSSLVLAGAPRLGWGLLSV